MGEGLPPPERGPNGTWLAVAYGAILYATYRAIDCVYSKAKVNNDVSPYSVRVYVVCGGHRPPTRGD